MGVWELLKWGILSLLGGFYTLLLLAVVFKIYRALTTPVDEIELIEAINKKNESETLIEWKEREN
jgi:hypothetical protein